MIQKFYLTCYNNSDLQQSYVDIGLLEVADSTDLPMKSQQAVYVITNKV